MGRRPHPARNIGRAVSFCPDYGPRVLKAAYSKDWKTEKPVGRDGVSHCIKVLRLESYGDALNNLTVRRSTAQQNLLDASNPQGTDGLCEQYILRYMLRVETQNSQSLLNVTAFADPFAYVTYAAKVLEIAPSTIV